MSNIKNFWCDENAIRYMHSIFTEEGTPIAKIVYETNGVELHGVLTTVDDVDVYHKGHDYWTPDQFPEDLVEKLKIRLESGLDVFVDDGETAVESINGYRFIYDLTIEGNVYGDYDYRTSSQFNCNSVDELKNKMKNLCESIIKHDVAKVIENPSKYTDKYTKRINAVNSKISELQKNIDFNNSLVNSFKKELKELKDRYRINSLTRELEEYTILKNEQEEILKELIAKRDKVREDFVKGKKDNG